MHHHRATRLLLLLALAAVVALLVMGCQRKSSPSPEPPTVSAPAAPVRVGPVALSGAAPSDSVVEVLADGEFAGRARADAGGAWSLTISAEQPGPVELTVRTLDADGNPLAQAAPLTLEIAPPLAALTVGNPDLTDPVVGSDYRVTAQLEWSGTAEPGATVVVRNDGAEIGAALVDSSGAWSYTGSLDLPPGAYAFSAQQVVDGAVVDESAEIPFDVPDLSAQLPPLTIAAEFRDDAADLSGMTGPGSLVDILRDGAIVAQAAANSSGRWSFRSAPIDDVTVFGARYPLALVGDGPLATPVTITIAPPGMLPAPTIDVALTADGAVQVAGSAEPEANLSLTISDTTSTVSADADGAWALVDPVAAIQPATARVRYADAKSKPASVGVRFVTRERADDAELQIALVARRTDDLLVSGYAPAGEPVTIAVNGALADTVVADANGAWRWRARVPQGDTVVEARSDGATDRVQLVLEGELGLSVAWDAAADIAPTLALAAVTRTADGLVALQGAAPPLSTVTLTLDGAALDAVTAGPDGQFTAAVTLPPGVHALSATTSAEPGTQRASDPLVIAVPDATDGVIAPVLTLGDSAETGLLRGSAAPDAGLIVWVEGEEAGRVSADASGRWQFELPATASGSRVWAQYATDSYRATPISVDVVRTGALQLAFTDETTEDNDVTIAVTAPATELVFDASWSMSEPLGTSTRAQAARDALTATITRLLPPGSPLALRAFGNIEGNYVCRSDLMLPLGPLNRDNANAVVAALEPQLNANTAIAVSLASVQLDLAGADGPQRLVLITDGGETCGGNPAGAIQGLLDAGLDITVDVVGFAIDDPALAETFEQWATLGGGTYYDAASAEALLSALADALGVRYEVADRDGTVIASGLVGGPPVELPEGGYRVTLLTDGPIAAGEAVVSADATTLIWVEQE